ncbi:hypothetical protein DL93DRAFT_2169281 [Clavulina sp. PMI_390]|nr:hypothetical protein DL93DRAFT_2169281 [Clavulina sp. PMI_390]
MFATPKAHHSYASSRALSQREKEKILQLYDMELESRLSDLRAHLDAKLADLLMHSNNQITRLPPSVRTVTLREFGEKYNGELNALVRGMASLNVLRNNPVPPSVGKRKRHDAANEKEDEAENRKTKTARQAPDSPQKPLPPRTAHGTPGPRVRAVSANAATTASSSARQFASRPPQIAGPSSTYPSASASSSHHVRSVSQSQAQSKTSQQQQQIPFPHSSSTFDPPRTSKPLPAYPRPMRPDEVILSENGSPVANPFSGGAAHPRARVGSGSSLFSGSGSGGGGLMTVSKEMKEVERELSIARIAVARDSSSTTGTGGTRSSQGTAVEREGGDGSALMLQVKTMSGHMVAFDPLKTLPEDLEARDDLPKEDKKAIAAAMLQFASTMRSWGNLASS